MPGFTSLPQMLPCCGRSWLQHCVSAKAASLLQWLLWNGDLRMPWSYRNTARGTIPTIPAAQCCTQTVEWDAEKTSQTPTPGSNSAWKTEQWLDPEQREPGRFYLLSKLLCCAVRMACTERPASFIMASNSLRLLFAKFSSISLVQQV